MSFANVGKSVVVRIEGGRERQSGVPAKLYDFLPNEVLTDARFNWNVEERAL